MGLRALSKTSGLGDAKQPLIMLGGVAVVAVLIGLAIWAFGSGDEEDLLAKGNDDQKLQAIESLSAEGSDRSIRSVARATTDASPRVAARALLAVSRSRLEERAQYLRDALRKDRREEVREAAVVGLANHHAGQKDGAGKKDDAQTLARVASNSMEAPRVRAAALGAIGQMRAYEARGAALAALEDPDPKVRGQAAAALRTMIGRDFHFRADDPPAKRKAAVAKIRAFVP